MKMSRRKVRETIFLLLFRVEFNTQEEANKYLESLVDEPGAVQYAREKTRSISRQRLEVS